MIDGVLALVEQLVEHVTHCGVPLMDPSQAAAWTAVREDFASLDAGVQEATQNLINTSFRCAMVTWNPAHCCAPPAEQLHRHAAQPLWLPIC